MFLHVVFWNTIIKMTTYAPKTLLRLYKTDNTYVCTAVVLNTGQVYEVKNNDGAEKKTYDSHESWKAERGADMEVRADATKSSGSITGKPDANGFIDHCGYEYTQWLLFIMKEGAPHLLKNEAVRDAFNNLTATVNKYREVLTPNGSDYTRRWKYYECNIGSLYSVFGGFPVHVSARPFPAEYGEKEIKTAHIDLIGLIGPDVKAYLKKKNAQINAACDLKYNQKKILKFQYKASKLAKELKSVEWVLQDLKEKKAKLEEIIKS